MRRVSTSNRLDFESLLRIYRETDLSQEKTRILSSLACSPDPNIILEALNFLLSSEVSWLYIIVEVKSFSFKLINCNQMEHWTLMQTLFPT